jgi:hypothetical protein
VKAGLGVVNKTRYTTLHHRAEMLPCRSVSVLTTKEGINMRCLVIIPVFVLLAACSPLQSYETFSKEAETEYTVSIGKEVYRVKRERDLPNAFGNADIYGGKIDTGYTELRFAGLTAEGNVIFRLMDIEMDSNETTMSRYGSDTSTITSTVDSSPQSNNPYYVGPNTDTINSTVTTHHRPQSSATQLPPNTVEFIFNPNEKVLKLDNVSVELTKVTSYSISYILHR